MVDFLQRYPGLFLLGLSLLLVGAGVAARLDGRRW